ncbi:hypothetical protein HMPREF0973_00263 [Prevotella veroralis F0319]|uniref:Uncharacterized protein n=1 Tax=Prevotella veroralis F0319 TaxID=649761 RepID=C9MKY8_9BACT|nr:hypothetical protein HMPREF0973_00263 [Prevotella veroralis F0319]
MGDAVRRQPKNQAQSLTKMWVDKGRNNHLLRPLSMFMIEKSVK